MNLNMIRAKNQTEDFLLSITKICQTLIEQTHRKAEETLEFKIIKPRETFYFNSPTQTNGDWMLRLTDLEVYNSIFNITEENNKIKLVIFLMKKLVVFHTQMSEMRLKETWIFQILQLLIYKMI